MFSPKPVDWAAEAGRIHRRLLGGLLFWIDTRGAVEEHIQLTNSMAFHAPGITVAAVYGACFEERRHDEQPRREPREMLLARELLAQEGFGVRGAYLDAINYCPGEATGSDCWRFSWVLLVTPEPPFAPNPDGHVLGVRDEERMYGILHRLTNLAWRAAFAARGMAVANAASDQVRPPGCVTYEAAQRSMTHSN